MPSANISFGRRVIEKVLETTLSVGSNSLNSSVLPLCQRLRDERGILLVEFASDPGITGGFILPQVRAVNLGSTRWADVRDPITNALQTVDLTSLGGPNWNAAFVGLPLFPKMRIRVRNLVVTNGVVLKIWMMQ